MISRLCCLLSAALLLSATPSWADLKSADCAASVRQSLTSAVGNTSVLPREHFEHLAQVIEANREEFRAILKAVDSPHGADYELTQVLKTLRGAEEHEARYLANTQELQNVAVYGSTNIPLYTLVMHGAIPSTISKNVWFRTPERTRDVYQRLFALLKEKSQSPLMDRIHLLTDSKDVQYDNFRKMHVLGLNRKGKRFERPPSEVVIFTGNPRTADEILESNITKARQVEASEGYKQVFLKFGAGLNPVIVADNASNQLEAATDAVIEAIRINSCQDCIAPKFYAVSKKQEPRYFELLNAKLSRLRYGSTADDSADYSPLTFRENFDGLVSFREKYAAYLKNPTAILDPTTKRVDPHIFVFPANMFEKVELEEHYAPFLVHFNFSSDKQLKEIANDPRVRQKAMYASVFADSSSTQTPFVRKPFEDNFHSTSLNTSVFAEESGNFPFGGYGGDASSAVTIVRTQNGQIRSVRVDRPLLFSQEAARAFPIARENVPPATVLSQPPQLSSAKGLKTLLEVAQDPSRYPGTLPFNALDLQAPFRGIRPRGISALREIARKMGYFKVIRGPPPSTKKALKELERFHGARLVHISGRSSRSFTQSPGLALHESGVGADIVALNNHRGTVNPHLGYGHLHAALSDKTLEAQWADAIWPGIMPRFSTHGDLVAKNLLPRDFAERRSKIISLINQAIQKGDLSTDSERMLRTLLEGLTEDFMSAVRAEFPEGAFLKNFGESTTGDLGNQINSFNTKPFNMATELLKRLKESISAGGSFAGSQFQDSLTSAYYETGTKFLNSLLRAEDSLLIQGRVRIAKTDLGFNREIRVDYIDGESVLGKPRFTHEYLPEDVEEAKKVINNFFAKAPEQFRYLSGGADVARMEDGTWKIIEFNSGPYSGTMDPHTFPIDSNLFMTELLGVPTPIIQDLESAFAQGVSAQKKYLQSLRQEEELWNKSGFEQISIAEVARWMRNRHLDEWRRNPTPERAEQTLKNLETLFDGVGRSDNRDLPLLLRGARSYIERRLLD